MESIKIATILFSICLAVTQGCQDTLPQCPYYPQACTDVPELCLKTCRLCNGAEGLCEDMDAQFCMRVIPTDTAYCNTLHGALACKRSCGKCFEQRKRSYRRRTLDTLI
ncbi:uncharacterized protein [Clytia hemisphaerica]